MKAYIFIAALFILAPLAGCHKNAETPTANKPAEKDWTNKIEELRAYNESKVTIIQGVAGTLTIKEGDCMPGVNPATCKEYPIKQKIRLYEYTPESLVTRDKENYITSIGTKMLGITEADKEGFFQLYMPTGKYSMVMEYNGRLYCNSSDGEGGLFPVVVKSNKVNEVKPRVDEATY